jgi:hypothetical protein
MRRRVLPAVLLLLAAGAAPAVAQTVPLPYDASNPVLYDNDAVWESGWTDPYLFALASAGRIDLRGIVTTGVWPLPPGPAESWGKERQPLVDKARRSGMRNLPDVVDSRNVTISSRRPASRRIEDTPAVHSDGGRKIVEEARKCSAEKPLVVVVGGLATSVADAYLIDPAIADKVIVAWLAGSAPRADGTVFFGWYNATEDAWAAYIVMERFRCVVIPEPFNTSGAPLVPRARLLELPDTEMRRVMLESWYEGRPTDADGPPVVTLTRPSYILESKRYSFSHFEPAISWGWNEMNIPTEMPVYRPDPAGRVIIASRVDQNAGTEEWWARVKDPAAWAGQRVDQAPYGGAARMLPGTIEAEHFDEGGNGRAYQDTVEVWNYEAPFWQDAPRFMESVDTVADASASGGAKVGHAKPGEWLAYTVQVAAAGTFELRLRVASGGNGGTFHLEIDGADVTGAMSVPDTGGWSAWQTVSRGGLALAAGTHVLRLVMDANGATGFVGDFDSIVFAPAAPAGGGTGLAAEYFANPTLSGTPALTRTDAAIDFDWGAGAPDPALPSDGFSVRWSGRVVPAFTEIHTFHATSDDGVRLWVDGRLLIDAWLDQAATEWSQSIALTAGQAVDLVMEYYENGGDAVARLAWSGPSTPKSAIPTGSLQPGPGTLHAPAAVGTTPRDARNGDRGLNDKVCGALGLESLLLLALRIRRRRPAPPKAS